MSLYQSRKTLDHTYHKCLLLSLEKTGAAPALRMKQQLVMRRLLSSMTEGHHHEKQQLHSHQDDPCQHLRQQTTQHRVIPTRLHHQHPQRFNNRIMSINTLIQTINSFQMAVIGTSMISGTRFSMQDTWRMETMHTYYICQNFKICYTQADSSWMKHLGQFYAIYGNTYQKMSTKPMLKEKWGSGELINQLAAKTSIQLCSIVRVNTMCTAFTTSQRWAR